MEEVEAGMISDRIDSDCYEDRRGVEIARGERTVTLGQVSSDPFQLREWARQFTL